MPIEIQVRRENVATPGFTPPNTQTQVGDAIYWFNADHTAQHQPYLVKAGDWVASAMEPRTPSTQINTDVPGVFHYGCAIHPDEHGIIVVCSAVMIGPTGEGGSAFNFQNNVQPFPYVPQYTSVSFGNADAVQHWPMPDGGAQNAWFAQAINPGDISAPVLFNQAGNVSFHCALHPTETFSVPVQPATVTISNSGSGPALSLSPLQMVTGQAVTFVNQDTSPHQPAPTGGPANAWFANPIAPGSTASTSAVFNTPGTVSYSDALNPNLTGSLQVSQKS